MLTLALLAAQAGPVPATAGERLSALPRACPAGPSADGTIVVCGRPSDQRLHPLPPLPEARRFDPAGFRLPGGGSVRAHAIQTQLPGAVGQGAAVTLTVPFGKPKR